MGGVELRGDTLVVDRKPSGLDDLAVSVSSVLAGHDVEHVFVAGYVAILAGRARSTQDIDVLLERVDERKIDAIVADLEDEGYWGPAMPLSEAHRMLTNGENIWIAREGEMAPHVEAKYVRDRFGWASLSNAITAQMGDAELPIGPLELQIAFKLHLGTETDFEDAVHLYTLLEESLSTGELETWVDELDVRNDYERLLDA